jgi:hypothetical protein
MGGMLYPVQVRLLEGGSLAIRMSEMREWLDRCISVVPGLFRHSDRREAMLG